eukprot:TRINITY_DN938_c0_g1_i1.p2 TRINITY_DN938_c0_g1~~TRINITY_DN938_c0_g1_i1.p2  ORF type:complete len:156 (+),score=36.79 TRINITY_DN938_c0_g1_i1:41-469(+)
MTKFLKPSKVVLLTSGKYAGRKAVIIKNFDDGTGHRRYGHALVAGVDRYPLKVTTNMSKKRTEKRSRVKAFVKVVNYNHLMPTRYGMDLDLKKDLPADTIKAFDTGNVDPATRKSARKHIRKAFQERYLLGKSKWFFTKLRF